MYNFYIDGEQLPVAPPSMTMQINNKNETVVLINEGEVNILKKPGLTDIEFEVLLPNVKYPFAVYPNGFLPAAHFLDKFEHLKVKRKSFQLIVNRMRPSGDLLFDTNITVSLEDYDIQEDAENGFDVIVALRFKQYKPFGNKKLEIKKNSEGKTEVKKVENRSTTNKAKVEPYTVKQGDNLWTICKKFLGNPMKYPEIAKLNNIKNPHLIYPGQVIRFE